MKAVALLLALFFFVVGIFYGLGRINAFTESGTAHPHHVSHLVVSWFIALLCLIWYRFQGSPR
jgi:uncharacterized transporter YbjL